MTIDGGSHSTLVSQGVSEARSNVVIPVPVLGDGAFVDGAKIENLKVRLALARPGGRESDVVRSMRCLAP